MAIIIAETGLGKSRLVQALYQVLTTNPEWNPADSGYWPGAIVSDTGQIRVNPPLESHVPAGPPRFLWLGARWQPIDTRNVEERTCVIPALRDSLYVHVSIAQRHRTTWQRLRTSAEKTIKSEGPDIVKDKVFDLTGIPYAGLVLKLIRAGISARNAPTTVGEAFEKQQEDAEDTLLQEMREVFGGLGGGGLVLPTVLWLDDAHWIDPVTLRFLHRLWKEATEKRWPLLLVLTHFEREWNELRIAATRESLWGLWDGARGEACILAPALIDDLASRLIEGLPGLLPAQRELVLQKAAGNFLTLVENMGVLIRQPANFEARRLDGPLTQAGVQRVANWESDRDKRIEQRFAELEPTLQDLLGWATNAAGRAGMWFMPHCLVYFAVLHQRLHAEEPIREWLDRYARNRQLLDSCVDPLAVLGTPSPHLLEFRDRAFYRVASEYFKSYLAESETELVNTYRVILKMMINDSFDKQGDLRTGDQKMYFEKIEVRGFTVNFLGWDTQEARAQLTLALREFPLPKQPDWSSSWARAALRAILLYLHSADLENLWSLVRQHGPRLREVRWDDVPSDVASSEFLATLGKTLLQAGLADVATPMFEHVLSLTEKKEKPDPEKVIDILTLLSQLHLATYSFTAAEPLILRTLQLCEQTLGPDAPDVVRPLNLAARLFMNTDRYEEAEKYLLRAWDIHERTFGKDAPETLTYIQEDLGAVYLGLERFTDAEKVFRHLLAVKHGTDPESPDAARIMSQLGRTLHLQSNYKESESLQRHALAIQEHTYGTDQPEVMGCLYRLAVVLGDQGKEKEAESLLKRAVEVAEKAYSSTHLEVADALTNLASLYVAHEDEANDAHPDKLALANPNAAAEPLLLRAINIMENSSTQTIGRKNLLALRLSNLGGIYREQQRDDEAYDILSRAQVIFDGLGPDPDTFQRLKELMEACQRLGQFEVAEAFWTRMLTILAEEQKLAPDSPELEVPLNLAARLYMDLGRYDEAEKYLLSARGILERAVGKDGLELTTVNEDLGRVYMNLERYDDAEAQFRSIVASELGKDPESPRAATILSNLGVVLRHKTQYEEAESLLRRVLVIRERNLGPDAPELVETIGNLAIILCEQGRDKEAEPFLKRALEVLEGMRGPVHHEVAVALYNLALLYMGNDDETLAARLDRQVIREDGPGSGYLDAGKSQSHDAETLTRQGRLDAAEPLLLRAIAIMEGSSDRLSLAGYLVTLGKVYRERQHDDDAYDVLIRALVILDQELDQNEEMIFLHLCELYGICVRLDQFEVAEVFCMRMLAILENNPDQDPLVTADWLENIAPLYEVLGNDNQAQAYLQRAQEIRKNSAKSSE